MMKAINYYGNSTLKFEEAPMPTAGPGEIVLKVMSATTCGTDLKRYKRGYRGDQEGQASVFGHECAGIVYEVGEGVTKFQVGERVVSHNSAPCNSCYWCKQGQYSMCEDLVFAPGAWAEYRLIPAEIVKQNTFHMPDDMSYALASIVEPMACAVYNINEADVRIEDVVAINGAGPLGLGQIVAAKDRGAYVIVTDLSEFRLDCAKKLGADVCINIKEVDDQVQAVIDATPDKRGADIAIDCTGLPEIWEKNVDMVRKGGKVMEFGGCKGGSTVTFDCDRLHYSQLTLKGVFHTTPQVVEQTFKMICNGKFPEEIFIGNRYPLEKAEEALLNHAEGGVVKNEIVVCEDE
ncbi:MAG: zinc-binding dehydrogenase [Erysipelotrichaceae bacterium]|nr:zinc-binding dehydrogenase [Erysipelotrichaceae bacterium]